MYYVKEIDNEKEIVCSRNDLEGAIESMRYFMGLNKDKDYEVVVRVYTSRAAKNKDYGDYLQEQMDKYGSD